MTTYEGLNIEAPLPVIPARGLVLFPHTVVSVGVGRESTRVLADGLTRGDYVLLATQIDPTNGELPALDEVASVATLARVHRAFQHPRMGLRLVLEGLQRVRLIDEVSRDPFITAEYELVEETRSDEDVVLVDLLKEHIEAATPEESADDIAAALRISDPAAVADRLAAELSLEYPEAIALLEEVEVSRRLRTLIGVVDSLKTRAELKERLENEVRKEFGKNQREAYLRQQLKAIQKELGDTNEDGDELRDRLVGREFPEEVQKVVDRELGRLDALEPNQMEYQVIRKYLEVIADLPWDEVAETEIDLERVAGVLDDDHHGLDDVKKRILEHMAVLDLSGSTRATILCLAGPPGVGKTSLGESIARATDRPFVRIALGGVRDEAEIRGHRRTYVGALPGRIISALRKAEVRNPVVLLDEIDKLARGGWSGDPEAALLEVLDPEQNATFTDHFLEVPFDLSEVLFITTANDLSQLSAPLRDRLEIIEVAGYTLEEKAKIARNHLLPKRLADHAIPEGSLDLTDEALAKVVAEYTREAGVRQLNRQLTKICRAVALEYVKAGRPEDITFSIDEGDVADYLGRQRFHSEVAARTALPGVATGLAWTPVGGDILFVETSSMPGKGNLQITGQLGDVMQESARAAMSYLRSHADELDIDTEEIAKQDIHLHVPAGAVPKDGPSAGVTIFTALTSLLTGRRVRPDTAMTGECSLRGRVLPVGGIKSKVMAAHRAGIKRVILPHRNAPDLEDVPDEVLADLEVIFAEEMATVLEAALDRDGEFEPVTPVRGGDTPQATV